ncbi:hypothetical protein ACWGKK_36575 [Streptomyces chartreusis]
MCSFEFDGQRWIGPGDQAVVLISVRFEAAYGVGNLEVIQCPAGHTSCAAGGIVYPVAGPERGDRLDRGDNSTGV